MAKKLAIILTYVALLIVGPDHAAAQWRPWCLHEPGLTTTCIYHTYEQCFAARVGPTTYCQANPNYGAGPTGTRSTRERLR